ncbi:hypothetical protein ACJX0J_038403, partial [Zea mays]
IGFLVHHTQFLKLAGGVLDIYFEKSAVENYIYIILGIFRFGQSKFMQDLPKQVAVGCLRDRFLYYSLGTMINISFWCQIIGVSHLFSFIALNSHLFINKTKTFHFINVNEVWRREERAITKCYLFYELPALFKQETCLIQITVSLSASTNTQAHNIFPLYVQLTLMLSPFPSLRSQME